jgi:5-formyltetrahydrofolate cyclo-ligase
MLKKELRKTYRARRTALSYQERLKLDDLILIQFQEGHPEIPDYIMTYAPMEQTAEFNPDIILDYCSFKNPAAQFIYPVMQGQHLNALLTETDTAFEVNAWGIEEPVDGVLFNPEDIQLIIVPLLIADKGGHRVGYGKGFYDRFLPQCSPDVVTIGFSYFEPVEKIEDVLETDVPLNYLFTPENFYEFE